MALVLEMKWRLRRDRSRLCARDWREFSGPLRFLPPQEKEKTGKRGSVWRTQLVEFECLVNCTQPTVEIIRHGCTGNS